MQHGVVLLHGVALPHYFTSYNNMKTKTTDLINKFLIEELNQPQPQPQVQPQPQPQTQVQPQETQTSNNQEETPKIEIYIPLHNGRFTNKIFTTNKNVIIKVLDDSVESDLDTFMELENNPSAYHEVSV